MTEASRNELNLDNSACCPYCAPVSVNDKKGASQEIEGHVSKYKVINIAIGTILFVVALIFTLPFWGELTLYGISYILIGGEVVLKAVRNIFRGKVFDENSLMSIATIGAFIIKEFPEAVAVMLFYQVGEYFQGLAVKRSRKSIESLMDIRPEYANLVTGNEVKKVSPSQVHVGDIILVKPGERIPLDGKVVEGSSMMDTSALTGESVPRSVEIGSEVLSGAVNTNGLLSIEVAREFADSTVTKILDLVRNESSKKAPTEKFITRFARYYTPVIVISAVLLAVVPTIVIPGATFSEWLHRALVFLVVSCPCALVISIPLGFFGGIGGASKKGILVKGGNFLEALNNVDTIVFDKTGTLTKGVFKVTDIRPAEEMSEFELLELAALAESYSNHPIARSIQQAYQQAHHAEIDKAKVKDYEEIIGNGIRARIDGKIVLAGNSTLIKEQGINIYETSEIGSVVHFVVDGSYKGSIVISDEVKADSKKALEDLRAIGVKRLVMLTGDSRHVGEQISSELGLDEIHAELLPDQKVKKIEEIAKTIDYNKKLVFVGDGINDAPVLARADVGVAMGGIGSDAAIEAADIVLMTDEPSMLVEAIKISRRTKNIVWQNIIFSLSIKGIVLTLGAAGIATMWEAVFADVGVTILAVLNSMRATQVK